MQLPIDELRRFVKHCDPSEPLSADHAFYVPLDADARGGDQGCVGRLKRTLDLAGPLEQTCQLFTGFPGAGKTTELMRLQHALEADRSEATRAVYIDFEQYIDRFSPITISDVLRVCAYVLDREATIAESKDPDARPGYLERLWHFLRQDVHLKDFGYSNFGPELLFELRDNPTFRERAREVMSLRFQQFAEEAVSTMAAAVVRLRAAAMCERVVVLADSLEKLTPVREEDRRLVESSVEALFLQHARLLQIPCHVIYTFPFWLGFRTAGLGSAYHQETVILPMVKVRTREGEPWTPGIARLEEIVRRRLDVDRVFGSAERLRPLLEASGGYPRDLLRLLREVLFQATSFPVTAEDVERVISQLSQSYADVVRSTDIPLLDEVERTNSMPLGDNDQTQAFGRLLDRWLVLAYRDDRRWYGVHPLVAAARDRFLRPPLQELP